MSDASIDRSNPNTPGEKWPRQKCVIFDWQNLEQNLEQNHLFLKKRQSKNECLVVSHAVVTWLIESTDRSISRYLHESSRGFLSRFDFTCWLLSIIKRIKRWLSGRYSYFFGLKCFNGYAFFVSLSRPIMLNDIMSAIWYHTLVHINPIKWINCGIFIFNSIWRVLDHTPIDLAISIWRLHMEADIILYGLWTLFDATCTGKRFLWSGNARWKYSSVQSKWSSVLYDFSHCLLCRFLLLWLVYLGCDLWSSGAHYLSNECFQPIILSAALFERTICTIIYWLVLAIRQQLLVNFQNYRIRYLSVHNFSGFILLNC